jgi:hypothetical protein
MKYKYVEWIELAQNKVHCRAIFNMVKRFRIPKKYERFFFGVAKFFIRK